jgi:single-strand DNA-binding protein
MVGEGKESMSMNKVILIGRAGKQPVLTYTPAGTAIAKFSVATSEHWTDKNGQKQEKTEWHNIVVFGKSAEVMAKYINKGSLVSVEGKLQTNSYDKEGQKHYSTQIVGENIRFLGGKPSGQGKSEEGAGEQSQAAAENYDIQSDASFAADDIPF